MIRDEKTVPEITGILMNEFKLELARLRPRDFDPKCEHCLKWMKRFHEWAEDRARHIVDSYGENPEPEPDPQRGTF